MGKVTEFTVPLEDLPKDSLIHLYKQVHRERKEMLALLRETFDVPPDIFGPNYDDRCLVSRGSPLHLRVLALFARLALQDQGDDSPDHGHEGG